MEVLILLIVLFVLGGAMMFNYNDCISVSGFVLLCCVSLALVTIPAVRWDVTLQIEGYYSLQSSLEAARASGNELETATIYRDVIGSNRTLAKYQYINESLFGLWIPDTIATLEPLK